MTAQWDKEVVPCPLLSHHTKAIEEAFFCRAWLVSPCGACQSTHLRREQRAGTLQQRAATRQSPSCRRLAFSSWCGPIVCACVFFLKRERRRFCFASSRRSVVSVDTKAKCPSFYGALDVTVISRTSLGSRQAAVSVQVSKMLPEQQQDVLSRMKNGQECFAATSAVSHDEWVIREGCTNSSLRISIIWSERWLGPSHNYRPLNFAEGRISAHI